MAARLNPQQMDDMRAAYSACLDGEIPDWRHGFFDLAMLVIRRVPDNDIVRLESLVNNWQQVDFTDIFRELETIIDDHQRRFRDLETDATISSDDDNDDDNDTDAEDGDN